MTARAVRRMGVIVAALAFALAPVSRATADPLLAAAGDIACTPGTATTATTCQQQATANLIAANAPTSVAALGDDQYNSGTYAEFTKKGGCF